MYLNLTLTLFHQSAILCTHYDRTYNLSRIVNLQLPTDRTCANQCTFANLTDTLRGFFIFSTISTSLSSTTSRMRLWATCKLSPSLGTTRILCSLNNAAITATNSTWANFLPGQIRAPSDHGM